MRIYRYVLSAFLLISCGGGGGGGSSPSAPAPQNITVSLTSSADSAEVNSSITLTWSSTLATSCSASGAWSGSKGTSGSESIAIGVGGSNTFSLSCSATGANSGSASTTVNGLRYFDGKVFDGYIRGAEVFVDTNDNLTLDANEASVTTDNQGDFTKLLYDNGILVSMGGIDSDTGADLSKLTLVHKLEGYEASKLASPFTTLIAYMSDASNLNAALGIDASINLMNTDPIPNLGEGIYDQMYEKGNQLTVLSYTLQNHSDAVDGTSELYFQAIADQLEESYAANQAAVDIEDPTFISKVIDKAETASATTLSPDVKANLNTVLSATIPLLKVYADSNTTSAVQRFAFSTLQNDVKDSTVMIGNASSTLLKYENNVFEYVATDQSIDESVINPDFNFAPVITSAAIFSAAENQISIGSVTATDADGDSLTYFTEGQEINISSSGVLTFDSAPDYETKNTYTTIITVSDGTNSTTQDITVNVTDIEEVVANQVPIFTSSATFSASENQTAIGTVIAADANGDSLTYSISGSEINISSSGVLTFVVAPDYEKRTLYSAIVTVSNGINSSTQEITISVLNVNDNSPVFTNSSIQRFGIYEGSTFVGLIEATDSDGDVLQFSISGESLQINSSGEISFKNTPNSSAKRFFKETVTVTDQLNVIEREILISIYYESEVSLENLYQVANSDLGPYFSDMSGDGKTILFGKNFGDNSHATECTIAKYSSSNWTYIDVSDNSEFICGNPVSHKPRISYDGTFFLSDNSQYYENIGDKVFQLIDGTMNQLGNDIETSISQNSSYSTLSSDGKFVCFVTHDGFRDAFFEIWEYANGSWSLRGSRISVDENYPNDLNSCVLSHNNSRVVVGSPQNPGADVDSRGYLKIYEFTNNDWNPVGGTIRAKITDFSGPHINNEGNIIAGSGRVYASSSGLKDVLIYEEKNAEWTQLGDSISNGVSSFAMNKSGNMIALVVRKGKTTNTREERLSLYQYFDNEWYEVLKRGLPSNYPTGSGTAAIKLSDDGQTIAYYKGVFYDDWQIIKITNFNP